MIRKTLLVFLSSFLVVQGLRITKDDLKFACEKCHSGNCETSQLVQAFKIRKLDHDILPEEFDRHQEKIEQVLRSVANQDDIIKVFQNRLLTRRKCFDRLDDFNHFPEGLLDALRRTLTTISSSISRLAEKWKDQNSVVKRWRLIKNQVNRSSSISPRSKVMQMVVLGKISNLKAELKNFTLIMNRSCSELKFPKSLDLNEVGEVQDFRFNVGLQRVKLLTDFLNRQLVSDLLGLLSVIVALLPVVGFLLTLLGSVLVLLGMLIKLLTPVLLLVAGLLRFLACILPIK